MKKIIFCLLFLFLSFSLTAEEILIKLLEEKGFKDVQILKVERKKTLSDKASLSEVKFMAKISTFEDHSEKDFIPLGKNFAISHQGDEIAVCSVKHGKLEIILVKRGAKIIKYFDGFVMLKVASTPKGFVIDGFNKKERIFIDIYGNIQKNGNHSGL